MLTINLNTDWEFSQAALNEWRPACIPGTVHTDLLALGLIEDPFYQTNEKDQQWIDKTDWEYRKSFRLETSVLDHKSIELCFQGLDTYAFVFLNDHLILKTENMFRQWSENVKPYLQEGDNQLIVYFQSPVRRGMSEQKAYGMRLPAVNDQSGNGGVGPNKVSVFTRKAGYHYGWDWGPRFVTSGIWRPVELKVWNDFRIKDLFIHQERISGEKALLNFQLNVERYGSGSLFVVIDSLSEEFTPFSGSFDVACGEQTLSVPITINNPRLWWCNGHGAPEMYDFRVIVSDASGHQETRKLRIGLRSIKLVREPDADGESFCFELNGRKIFAKGANYIPNDVFLPRVTVADYRKVLADAVAANMNMIRVWGGGIYENDIFYELCDEMGIMVWQDFMFACSLYPGNEEFLDNVRQEAVENVIRLRNHASIALWCGNNEIHTMWAWHSDQDPLGWKGMFSYEQRSKVNQAYEDLFHDILPEVVTKYAGGIDYWPSSPQAGCAVDQFADAATLESGDQHYWGVWHGLHPFSDFDQNVGRFMSEYGFQSFPELESVKRYTIAEDWDIESEVMAAHQRSGIGNLRIKEYMAREYLVPDDFEQFLFMSQVLQAQGIKRGIEAHRRNMPRCMGSLYWQLNDCWPVASWAGTDYYRKWKALHYAARRAFEPVLIAPVLKDQKLSVFIVSDLQEAFVGTLKVKTMNFSGKKGSSLHQRVTVNPNTSNNVLETDIQALTKRLNRKESFLQLSLEREGNEKISTILYFVTPKEMKLTENPKIKTSFYEAENKGIMLKVESDSLIKDLMFFVPDENVLFSDNCFDLIPGEPRVLFIETTLQLKNLQKHLVWRHLKS